MNQIGIYITKNTPTDLLNEIASFYKDEILFIFMDDLSGKRSINNKIFPVINFFRAKFSKAKILFTSIQDLESNAQLVNEKILIINRNQIPKLNKQYLTKTEILINEKTRIRKAKNAELQSILG